MKVGNYERKMAAMELKRALVTVREMYADTSPEVEAKSNQVIASIESLLQEFDAGIPAETPAGVIKMEEAPAAAPEPVAIEEPPLESVPEPPPEPAVEASAEEPPSESAPEPAEEEPAASEEPAPEAEEGGEEGGDEDEGDEEDDEEEDE